jgi:hypothetical protein
MLEPLLGIEAHLGRDPQLDDKIAGQILRLNLTALLPEPITVRVVARR